MTQNHQTAILLPLLAGSVAVLCTIVVHALVLGNYGFSPNFAPWKPQQGFILSN